MPVPAKILAKKNQIVIESKLRKVAKRLGLSKLRKTSARLHWEGTRRICVRNEVLVNGKICARYGVGMDTLYWMEVVPANPDIELHAATGEDEVNA